MTNSLGDPASPLVGSVRVPGDKSISHRAAILAALARGRSRVSNANMGADVRATVTALRRLGVPISVSRSKRELKIEGSGWAGLGEPDRPLDVGNSGTTIRTMLGVCAALPVASVLTGDASIRRRPMLRVVSPLRQMGATVDGRSFGDRAPLFVRGGGLSGVDFRSPVASAQLKSAVLLAGLRAAGRTTVTEPSVTRDHTERMLAAAGVDVVRSPLTASVVGGSEPQARDWTVPGDFSSAMFLVVAAALVPHSRLVIEGVGLNPTRTAALDVLRAMGAGIQVHEMASFGEEPMGDLVVEHRALRGVDIAPALASALIDEIPALAVAACGAEGETVIRGAAELRVKESDRLAALANGLRALGADVEELPDGLVVRGPSSLRGGEVDSYGDHRIAMAFQVVGLVADGPVRVRRDGSVETSFPGFGRVLAAARGQS